MALKEALYALLATHSDNVFPNVADPVPEGSYVVYACQGGDPLNYTEGGVPDDANVEAEITAWARTRTEADALIDAIAADLRTTDTFQAEPLGEPLDMHDAELGRYGAQQDFSIWGAR